VYRGLRKMVMSWSLGLVLVGVAAFVSADPPKPLDEIMEEVQQVNKALIKFNRMTKAQFDEPGRGEQVAKEAEKMAALMKEVLRHAPQEDQKENPRKFGSSQPRMSKKQLRTWRRQRAKRTWLPTKPLSRGWTTPAPLAMIYFVIEWAGLFTAPRCPCPGPSCTARSSLFCEPARFCQMAIMSWSN